MPELNQRVIEMEAGHFGHGQVVSGSNLHRQGEQVRQPQFQVYVDIVRRFAPVGKWLDIGCGTGMLIKLAQNVGVDAEGIELTSDRRMLARQLTGASIHEHPIEHLNLPSESFAAVTLVNVFSHLTSPTMTLSHIRRVLSPGGIMLLHTSEIGPGVRKHHTFSWDLGDHLYFLGESTIDRYAKKVKCRLIHRDRNWQPAVVYTRERFRMKGRSKLRNLGKMVALYTPGVFPLLRWYMLSKSQAGNPIYTSTLILKAE
jgi:SAM-dependent methyltransferase